MTNRNYLGDKPESKGGDPGQQIESDDQPPQQTDALRRLNNTRRGNPSIVLSSRTRSCGGTAVTDLHKSALNVALASDGELEDETVAHESATNLTAMKAALVTLGGIITTYLPSLKVAVKP